MVDTGDSCFLIIATLISAIVTQGHPHESYGKSFQNMGIFWNITHNPCEYPYSEIYFWIFLESLILTKAKNILDHDWWISKASWTRWPTVAGEQPASSSGFFPWNQHEKSVFIWNITMKSRTIFPITIEITMHHRFTLHHFTRGLSWPFPRAGGLPLRRTVVLRVFCADRDACRRACRLGPLVVSSMGVAPCFFWGKLNGGMWMALCHLCLWHYVCDDFIGRN